MLDGNLQVPSPYKPAPEIRVGTECILEVTQVDYPDRVYVQLGPSEGGDEAANKELLRGLTELEELVMELVEQADNYPKLDPVEPGSISTQLCW